MYVGRNNTPLTARADNDGSHGDNSNNNERFKHACDAAKVHDLLNTGRNPSNNLEILTRPQPMFLHSPTPRLTAACTTDAARGRGRPTIQY